MTKLAPEWVRTRDPVIRSPARYHRATAPARAAGLKDCTVEILLKEDFDSVDSIRCLTEEIVQV